MTWIGLGLLLIAAIGAAWLTARLIEQVLRDLYGYGDKG